MTTVPEKRTFILNNLREYCRANGKRYVSERLETNLTDINQRANVEECDRLASLMLEDGIITKIPWQPEGDEIEAPFLCRGCGRPEPECSENPCPAVLADREPEIPAEVTGSVPDPEPDDRGPRVVVPIEGGDSSIGKTLAEIRDVFAQCERTIFIIVIQ